MENYWPIAIAYLLGSIPSGLIIAKAFGIEDIRLHGSGNIGATNVWRVIGPKAAIWVYLLDIGKGALAVFIASRFAAPGLGIELFVVLAAVMAVMGSLFSIFLKFMGGKGVNTSLGCVAVLLPLEILISLISFFIVVILSRYISLGSVVGGLVLMITLFVEAFLLGREVASIYLYLSIGLAVMVLVTHRENLRRIFNGTENRFSLSSKTTEAGSGV